MAFSKRISNMELLRIISIFFIIIFHFVYKGGFAFSSSFSINKLIVKSFWMLGELGVNLFVLITGYFMVNSKFKLKKLIILLAEVLFYYLVTVMVAYLIGIYEISNLKDVFLLFFPTLLNRYWFITAYIIIYIFSPYLNILITAMNKVQYKKLLLLLIFLYSIIPTFFGAFFNSSESMLFYNRLIWLIIIYLIGAYIKLYSIKIINTKKKSIFLIIISFLTLILSILIIDKFEKFFSMIGIKEIAYLWTPNNIFMLLLSLGVFILFTYIKIPTNKLINKVASTTLGIYLLHDGVLAKWIWLDVFKNYSYQNSKFLIIYILGISIIVFLVCMFIDLIRQFIEKYTIVNILNSKRVNKNFNKLKNKLNLIEEGK